jgi:uncharacterized protein
MAIIDADAHVVESENTWTFMAGADAKFRPQTVKLDGPDGVEREHWAIDGRLISKGPISVDEMTRAQREMDDMPGRLRHMDQLGTDVQVLYPTIFLGPVTEKPEVEAALYRAYNRWLADIWQQSKGRMRWAVMLPYMSMDAAMDELRFGLDNGACGVFIRGIDAERQPSDPYFFPVYSAAQEADVPICVHAATGSFAVHDFFPDDPGIWRFKVPGINAFHTLLMQEVPDKFPTLRWCFVELAAQWVPYAVHDMVRRKEKRGKKLDRHTVVADNRFYVACQTDDDIPYVTSYIGSNNIIMGTDYGHSDTSSELEALKRLKEMPEVGPELAAKILDANAKAAYGF